MRTVVTIMAAACFAGAALAQQPTESPKPGPEHRKLQVWCGEWTYEGESHDRSRSARG